MDASDSPLYENYLSTFTFSGDPIGPRRASLTRDIRRHFPPDRDARILDIACGCGTLVMLAQQMGYRNIYGVDISHEQVAMAKRLGVADVRQGDGINVLREAATASLDLLVCYDVLEHFEKSSVLEIAVEAYRVLRPGGRWIIHAPNGDSPFSSAIRYGDITHKLMFTRTSMTQVLRYAGFTDMTFHDDPPGVHGPKSFLRWLAWKVIAGLLSTCTLAETGVSDAIMSRNFLTVAHRG